MSAKRIRFILAIIMLFVPALILARKDGLVRVPGGMFIPFLDDEQPTRIAAFQIQAYPVTNQDFYRFVQANPQWGPSRSADLFADEYYLKHWKTPSGSMAQVKGDRKPVTNVSYFAARAYCQWVGMRLPETNEWEYSAAFASTEAPNETRSEFSRRILSWYGKTSAELKPVGQGYQNVLGIYDQHGLIWEWTEDFNTATVGGDSRDTKESALFCGSAATAAADPSMYADFMRYAFRSGLQARSTSRNLGFRCASDL
ncbi:MAG: hypothetical protein CMN77_08175 [Spirochaetaceae bacterium]|nr:hypothetical protein [Spirochaetaceae bacterium]|tara:strand:- start:605 stop:1372 length:768 start_codon:yes stop_codon:yes gene_type:complete